MLAEMVPSKNKFIWCFINETDGPLKITLEVDRFSRYFVWQIVNNPIVSSAIGNISTTPIRQRFSLFSPFSIIESIIFVFNHGKAKDSRNSSVQSFRQLMMLKKQCSYCTDVSLDNLQACSPAKSSQMLLKSGLAIFVFIKNICQSIPHWMDFSRVPTSFFGSHS